MVNFSNKLLISNNPILCVRVNRDQNFKNCLIGNSQLYPQAVFLQTSCVSNLPDFEKQKVLYSVIIRIPLNLLAVLKEFGADEEVFKFDTGSKSIQLEYQSYSDLESKFMKDIIAVLQILEIAATLSVLSSIEYDIQILNADCIKLHISQDCQLLLEYSYNHDSIIRTCLVSLHSSLSPENSTRVSKMLNLLYREKAFFVPGMIEVTIIDFKNLISYLDFLLSINSLTNSITIELGLDLQLEVVDIYGLKIVFGDRTYKFGIQLLFFQNYVIMEDCALSGSTQLTALPYYEDVIIQSVNSPGILSVLKRICKTKIHYGDKIILPAICLPEVTYFLQSYIETVCCILKLHENVPANAAFEIASLRIMIPSVHTQFVFAGYPDKPVMAHKNKDKGFSQIAGYLLEKVYAFDPHRRHTYSWCKFLMELSGLKDLVVKDIIKLVELFGRDEKLVSESSWLLEVPDDLPSPFAAPRSTALYIKDNHLFFLFQFKDEKVMVILPLKRSLVDGGLSWWESNPYRTGMQMLEGVAFPKSRTEQFPGVASLITSLKKCPVYKIKN